MTRLAQWLWRFAERLPDPELVAELEGYALALMAFALWLGVRRI